MIELPLFPLKTVLMPGTTLSLKIFESRYIDMIARCMREDSNFGIILIFNGEESQSDSEIHSVGTIAKIQDWQDRSDGLLGISALGIGRFEVESTRTQPNGLTIATIHTLEEESKKDIPAQYRYMQQLLEHISQQEATVSSPDDGFAEILYKLIYLLPLDGHLKQRLLEVPKCLDRAVILHAELIRLGIIQYDKPDISD